MNKEAFRAGFIYGLADNGYTPAEFEGKLEKASLFGALGTALNVAAPLGLGALLLGIGGAKMLGRGVGSGVQKLTEPTEEDLEIVKKEEISEEYNRLISEAKLRAAEQLRVQTPRVM